MSDILSGILEHAASLAHAKEPAVGSSSRGSIPAPKGSSGGGYSYYTPKYTGSAQDQWNQYQAAVQKIDPSYNLSMGVYSPHMGNLNAQVSDLTKLYEASAAGKKAAEAGRPVSAQQVGFTGTVAAEPQSKVSSYINGVLPADAEFQMQQQHPANANRQILPQAIRQRMQTADKAGQARANQLSADAVNKYLSYAEKQGATKQDAISSLYQQLSGKGSKDKNLNDAFGKSQASQVLAAEASPKYRVQQIYTQQLLPMVNTEIQNMLDTANALDFYNHATSKQRTAMGGKPSTSEISAQLKKLMPPGAEITPDNIRYAAQQLGTQQGTEQYITDYLQAQAKQRGTAQNDLTALQSTSGGKTYFDLNPSSPNYDPLSQMVYDYYYGGDSGGGASIGRKKATSSSAITAADLTSLEQQIAQQKAALGG